MGKRKRKHQKTSFPWMVEEKNLFITKTGNEIVTDAGWEKISFEEARKLFSPETFQEWYELFLENTDISEILSESNVDIDLDDESAIDKFLQRSNWTPKQVNLVVAKAIYKNHAWVRALLISTPDVEEPYFQNYEMEAIHLGVQLRKYIKEDIPVINDCKDAVRHLYGRYALIGWQPKNCVTAAHNLKISQATKVYSELLWDEDWEDEEDCSGD
ncbi:hypothetical protein [Nostoc sp. ChiVER01]|uniref:hypothetical protein n=1 Tax=Nostoc sp. ChiVER01 TaxID=3075382 RepID=UPI002AD4C85C|nr:hypothetical protein [Nostoc sp. ChiVER01]MDZ8226703.1 hypothetical protein [Nostoc sp. ChiVER01]